MTNLEIKVISTLSNLSANEQKVAEYFLKNTNSIFHKPIAKLAQECGVSQVMWVRFCKTLGFSGLKEFKKELFNQLNAQPETEQNIHPFTDVKEHSSIAEIAQSVMQTNIIALDRTLQIIDYEQLEKVAKQISKAKCIRFFGVGASGDVAKDFSQKLQRIGKYTMYSADFHLQLTYAVNTSENDLAFFISNSGKTKEVIDALEIVKDCKCHTVSLTQYGSNPLSSNVDFNLFTSSPEIYQRSGAMSSRIAQLAVLDILFTCIANIDYENIETALQKSYDVCLEHKVK